MAPISEAAMRALWGTILVGACDASGDGWIATTFHDRPDVGLGSVIFPGTHDSASYGCAVERGIAPEAGELLNGVWELSADPSATLGRERVAAWARTQSRTLAEQLEDGVRYLDLRVVDREGELTTWHSVYSVPFDEAVDAIVAFADAHRREPVVLSIGPALDDAGLDRLADALVARRGGASVCDLLLRTRADVPASRTPLRELWRQRRPLIWADAGALGERLEARGCPMSLAPIEGHWSRTTQPDVVETVLAEAIAQRDADKILSNDFIFSLEGTSDPLEQFGFITTWPSLHDATVGLGFSGSLPGDLVTAYADGMNVFAGDFYEETTLLDAARAANEDKAAERDGAP
jgi:hypothetical protein